MGDDLIMPSFIAIIVGGVGSLTGTLLGGLLIGVASALTAVVPAGRERGGDLRHHGGRAADPPARLARRRRHADMSAERDRDRLAALDRDLGRAAAGAVLDGCLLGGYTALGTRVLVLALAAMSFNLLLGFTGVL